MQTTTRIRCERSRCVRLRYSLGPPVREQMHLRYLIRLRSSSLSMPARDPMTPEPVTASVAGYAAFISYSHAADGRLAPAVERGLERLARPWYRRRALRIF